MRTDQLESVRSSAWGQFAEEFVLGVGGGGGALSGQRLKYFDVYSVSQGTVGTGMGQDCSAHLKALSIPSPQPSNGSGVPCFHR